MDTRDRIFKLLDAKKIEQKTFAAQVGVSEGTVSNWRRGVSSSYTRYLVEIAQVLGTTTADLLGEKQQSSPSKTDRLLEVFGDLTEDEKQDVARYVDLVKARRKQ